jgi:hypothetical protein
MSQDCYRCGQALNENTVFCPNCNAPQIRVVVAQPVPASFSTEESPDVPVSAAPPPPMPGMGSIQWNVFFRIASPWAALTGFLSILFFPAGLLLIFPYATVRAISRYRPLHMGSLQGGHGARLGAFAALLSFFSFLIFFLALITLYRAALLDRVHQLVQQNTDPQTLQVLQWLTTNQGFVVATAMCLAFFLLLFLIVGTLTGALVVTASRPKTRF